MVQNTTSSNSSTQKPGFQFTDRWIRQVTCSPSADWGCSFAVHTFVCLSVCTCIFIVMHKEMLYCVYSHPLVSLSYFVQEKMLLSVQHKLLQWGQQPSSLAYLTRNVYLIWNILIYKWYAKTNAQIINITKFLFEKWMFVTSSSLMLFHTYAISHRSWEIPPPFLLQQSFRSSGFSES